MIQISDGLTWPANVAILNCFFKIKNAFNFPILFCTTKTAVAEFVLQQNALFLKNIIIIYIIYLQFGKEVSKFDH